ncbi:DUF2779 domain-containing protein, partial [Candidatus Berkelbacteria bacterium]|nr:DUF2779 domain-containing protein [Candidatus Berkelbacteria bacterium]
VTDKVSEVFPDVENNVSKALAIMKSSTRPDISPRHAEQRHMKDWLKIFLNLHLDSDPYSIYRLSGPKRDLLGELEDQGYELMKDVPNDFEGLHKKHQRQIELMRIGDPVIQKEKIREFLEPIKYPLYFLDYETTAGVVPLVDGMRPWQQLPIQYSIHVQNEPGAELIHKEFIHTEKSNPSEKLIDQLQQDIGTDGTILVWYEPFEKGRNIELGLVLPEQMDFVKEVNERVVDLMIPFKKGWYEDYRFRGSSSIKAVLPVLIPELSYEDLEVQDGLTAQRLWTETIFLGKNQADKDKLLDDLLAYCKLDTLAMVEIFSKLNDIVFHR